MSAQIAVTKERAGEPRVAATPDTVKKLIGLGFSVTIEAGAGLGASVGDQAYLDAGATIATTAAAALKDADVVLKVRGPSDAELKALKPGAILVALLNPHNEKPLLAGLAGARSRPSPWSWCRASPGPR